MSSPYALEAPSIQQTLDLFKGKWASRLPAPYEGSNAGDAALFEDPRVDWAKSSLAELGIKMDDSAVLELGPLEGGHTYGLIKAGAKSVTAIEAHSEAFLKCLVMKELLGIERVNFLFGDAVSFLKKIGHLYDIGFASGFLYHMTEPVEFLRLLCSRSRSIFLWTVYWDPKESDKDPLSSHGKAEAREITAEGFKYKLHRHNYGTGFDYGCFWGGPDSFSNWMEKDDILQALKRYGFSKQIVKMEPNKNGSSLMVAAVRD